MQLFCSSSKLPPRFSKHSLLTRTSLYHDGCKMMVFILGICSPAVSWHSAFSPFCMWVGLHAFTYLLLGWAHGFILLYFIIHSLLTVLLLFWCSDCPRFGPWEPLQAVFCVFVTSPLFKHISTGVLTWAVPCSRLTSHFLLQPWSQSLLWGAVLLWLGH